MSFTKKELRTEVKSKLDQLSTYEFKQACKRIEKRLFQSDIWKESSTIGLTISRGREVETETIVEQAWKEGKKVAVPKCFASEKRMEFYIIDSFSQLESVYFGLLEPIVEKTIPVLSDSIELLIVPGICYKENGYRIGYGGGYYDRYLKSYNNYTLSLLFECQLVSDMPIYSHDIPVQRLITEERTILCAK